LFLRLGGPFFHTQYAVSAQKIATACPGPTDAASQSADATPGIAKGAEMKTFALKQNPIRAQQWNPIREGEAWSPMPPAPSELLRLTKERWRSAHHWELKT